MMIEVGDNPVMFRNGCCFYSFEVIFLCTTEKLNAPNPYYVRACLYVNGIEVQSFFKVQS